VTQLAGEPWFVCKKMERREMRPIQFATLLFLDKPFCPAQSQIYDYEKG
jgi:hypothetical protein